MESHRFRKEIMEPGINQKQSSNALSSDRNHAAGDRQGPAVGKRQRMAQWFLVILPFLFLWAVLINQLRVEWEVNPQYSYGFVVPFLCVGMLFLRWLKAKGGAPDPRFDSDVPLAGGQAISVRWYMGVAAFLFALLAFLWLPTRLMQEANPEWRMISWLLALEVIGLTLMALWLRFSRGWAAQFVFPLCFFLLAVPWPTIAEVPLIQLLTRVCASFAVEVVGWLGIPAIQHGNVIEVASGTVGVDEACSGIRSFQSSLMISLFLGELYGLGTLRRMVLVPASFLLALLFNICRISFLTCVAARQGVAAISKYHDPAGLTIMIACTIALWLLALLLRRRVASPLTSTARPSQRLGPPNPALKRLAFGLLLWLVAAEAGVELWYKAHEWHLPPSTSWSVIWPRSNPSFSESPIAERAKWMLRYDEEVSAAWREGDGTQWQMIYLRWRPGRIAIHLATMHTPDVCLTAAGHTVETLPGVAYLPVRGLNLPFRKYILNEGDGQVYVFYCLWEDRAQTQFFKLDRLTYGTRVGRVLAGQRNCGERSLEIVVRGIDDASKAESAVVRELDNLLRVSESGVKSEM